jgi:hypothetical protein
MPCFATRQCNSALPSPHILPPRISKSESPENKSKSVAYILNTKSGHQEATIHHESTTNSPPKTTFYHPFSAKTPCKTTKISLPKNNASKISISRIALPNTNGSLILGQIQIIVEVGGLSNDEVYTNSDRGFALRVIFCHIRNFDRNCSIPQHKL